MLCFEDNCRGGRFAAELLKNYLLLNIGARRETAAAKLI